MPALLTKALGALTGGALLAALALLACSLPIVFGLSAAIVVERQFVPLAYNLRSLARRKITTLTTLASLVLVIFVLTAMLMMAAGIQHTLASTAAPENVIVLHEGAQAEVGSFVEADEARLLAVLPEVRQTERGEPLLSGELVTLTWLSHAGAKDPDDGANITLRGVPSIAFRLHPAKHIDGRELRPGVDELVIGKALLGRFDGAVLGGTMTFAGRDWKVVGVADHAGSAHDSEIWGDFGYLSGALHRGRASVTLALKQPDLLQALRARVAADPNLNSLAIQREAAYWGGLSKRNVRFVTLLGVVIATIFAFGAVLGAMNTMYAQVSARTRELATLRALGFRPRAILVSLILESVLLALAGGLVGVLAASVLQRLAFTSTSDETLSEISYRFYLSPTIALAAIGSSCLMGYAGGLLPALKAARTPIISALRGE